MRRVLITLIALVAVASAVLVAAGTAGAATNQVRPVLAQSAATAAMLFDVAPTASSEGCKRYLSDSPKDNNIVAPTEGSIDDTCYQPTLDCQPMLFRGHQAYVVHWKVHHTQTGMIEIDGVKYAVGCPSVPAAATNGGPDTIAVCSSHFGTDTNPDFLTPAEQVLYWGETNPDGSPSYWLASVTTRTVPGDTNILGGETLVCNPSTRATGSWIGHDGVTTITDAVEVMVQIAAGPNSGATRQTSFYQQVG